MYGSQDNNLTIPLDAAYHQMITNEFRSYWPYGKGLLHNNLREGIISNKVYEKYPLPPFK